MLIENTPVIEAERTVVGVLLTRGGERLDDTLLTEADFMNTSCATIYAAIRKIHAAGEAVSAATVNAQLPDRFWGEVHALASDYLHSEYAFESSADLIARNAVLGRALDAANTIRDGVDISMSGVEIVDVVRKATDSVEGAQRATVEFVGELLPEAIARAADDGNFVPTPWRGLNQIIGGLRPGCMYVVGARPGVGKSVIAQGLAVALAEVGEVAFVSLEMGKHELVQRMVAAELSVNIGKIKAGALTDVEREAAVTSARLLNSRIAINDRPGQGPAEIRAFVRMLARRGSLAGVVVDYMQLMTTTAKAPRHEAVSEFSRQMKLLAKEFEVPVIALAQLNRDSEGPGGRAAPRVSQLRESGAIEQDADVIMLLHREDDADGSPSQYEITIDVQKNRHGRTGYQRFVWEGGYSRVSDYGPH